MQLGRQNEIDKPEAIKTCATQFGYVQQIEKWFRNGEEMLSLVEKFVPNDISTDIIKP